MFIPFPGNNVIFELSQSLGIQRSQMSPDRIDIDSFAIVESRGLSRSSNMTLFFGNGITPGAHRRDNNFSSHKERGRN